jgi:hypothetical protein
MINKKASIEVGVMVIMTLLLFIYIIFAISNQSSKVSENFNAVSNIYSEKQGYENTLYIKLTEDFLSSYQKILSENSEKISSSADLNKVFEEDLKVRFKQTESSVPEDLKKLFSGVTLFYFDGKKVYTSLSPWGAKRVYPNLNITYSSELNVSVGFDNFGLPSLDKIMLIRTVCNEGSVKDSEVKVCLEQELPNFVISVIKEKQLKLVSGDEYYIDKEMKKIEFLLSFDYTESGSS